MKWAKLVAVPQGCSYTIVIAASLLGLLAPGWAGKVMGPVLLLGLVLLGVAHGACAQFVVPATHPALVRNQGRYWVVFVGGYLGLAAVMGVLWWRWPTLALLFFFGLSAWHWGSGDAPTKARYQAQWLVHSLLRGALIFTVPLVFWPAETGQLTNALLKLAGATPVSPATITYVGGRLWPLVIGGHWALWGSYFAWGQPRLAGTDALEVLLLTLLLLALPPVLAGSVYFVFWHSLQHMLRMNRLVGRAAAGDWLTLGRELRFFLRRAAPLLAVSVAVLTGFFGLPWVQTAGAPALISLALLIASIVTLPHAVLVTLGLDARRWRRAVVPVSQPAIHDAAPRKTAS